ncbi:MAG: hypothetical protein AB1798_09585, partial [Spirochaetota bacterium]
PEDLRQLEICTLSGQRPGSACTSTTYEYIRAGEEPGLCTYHTRAGERTIINYPPEYTSWLLRYDRQGSAGVSDSDLHIIKPKDQSIFYLDPTVKSEDQAVRIEALGKPGGIVDIFINQRFYQKLKYPYVMYFPLNKGDWNVKFKDEKSAAEVTFHVR